jgi:hypothetical protein
LGKNPKLKPKWVGPYRIVDINDNNTKLELKPNKFKVVNISRLNTFQEEGGKLLSQDDHLFKAIHVFLKTLQQILLRGLSPEPQKID